MGIISEVTLKEFKDLGVRLVVYADEERGGRIDLIRLDDPSVALFEVRYDSKSAAVEQFETINSEADAGNWAWRNS
jgi:Holliday junction resolvase-like predicted endonuclease